MARFGLIGKTLGHSFSPEVHRAFADYDYRLIELKSEEQVGPFLQMRAFDGLNVTIPYKRLVMPFLDEISDEAERIGSVNTIVNRGGKLTGYNTDYYGFCRMAEHAGISFSGKKVLVLGSGGASLTAVTAARDSGASAVYTVSRTEKVGAITYETAYQEHADADILVNATPVGMYPENGASPIELSRFGNCTGVLDMVFNPLKTALLLEAERRHIPCANGLMMLVAQGKRASELFTGSSIDASLEERALRSITNARKNLVLIGMPGSGKSTVGRLAAKRLDMEFVDLDLQIKTDTGRTPAEIIEAEGAAAFRRIETATAMAVGKGFHRVIAAGGGVVTQAATMDALMQNGLIVRIDRDLSRLATADRPLSKGGAALEKLYREREPLYRGYAKASVKNEGTVDDSVAALERIFAEELL